MHANLMRATRFELHAQQRMCPVALLDSIVRDRLATITTHRHLGALRAMSTDRFIDGSPAGEHAQTQGQILAPHFALGECAHEHRLRRGRTRHHQQARGVFIEAVHDAGARYARKIRIDLQKRILQRATAISGARMNHEPGRFVDHVDGRIAMQDFERHRSRPGNHAVIRLEEGLNLHMLTGANELAAAGFARIERHSTLVYPALQPRARVLRQQLG